MTTAGVRRTVLSCWIPTTFDLQETSSRRRPRMPTAALDAAEAAARLARLGPNAIAGEKPPSTIAVALAQLRNPHEHHADRRHGRELRDRRGLDRHHRRLADRAERRARRPAGGSRRGRAWMRCRSCRSPRRRCSATARSRSRRPPIWCPATSSSSRPGDIVPADGRILRSATLEAQEAALTGESAPIAEGRRRPGGREIAIGDRSNMLFQNTSVTRGTARDGRHRDRHAHRDGADRDDADLGHADPIAAAEGARIADEGARDHRLDRRSRFIVVVGRGRGTCRGRTAAARHGDGDLRDPHRHARVRVRAAVARREATRRKRRPS